MAPKAQGRMIKKDISNSNRFASLCPEAAVLFAMLIPHFNAHGKMNGGPGYIKDEVCPKIPYLTYKNIPTLLAEISNATNVKWFEHDGRYWIHSLNFLSEHQDLRPDRMGPDLFPDYSMITPGGLTVEEEDKEEDKGKVLVSLKEKNKKLRETFAIFWSAYPRKIAKQDAEKAWIKLDINNGTLQKILDAVDRYKKTEQWNKDNGQFIPYPASWLNKRRWEDELPKMPDDWRG